MADLVVEELASLCLQRMQEEGQQVLDEICNQYPTHAEDIRGMVEQLLKLGLMDAPAGEAPERIGDYRILRRLGGGGMGVVYLAVQTSLGRKVALKIMHPGFGLREKSRLRFRREIEAISAIDHPGVCTVYEAGEADGVPYLAMRFVEGETLGQILDEQRFEKKKRKGTSSGGSTNNSEILECAEKAARALHCAHEAGLVHRDVKPGNIMIDTRGEPVLLDFGLVQDAGLDSHDLTASGDLLGTPAYMSPEQVEGKVVDRRSDIYSLAVTIYECLTLRPPFQGANRQVIYNKILAEQPPDPRKKNRTISRDLWIVLSKALEKDPRLRFSSALELADELRRIQRHEPIQTVRPAFPIRALRWTQRNRAATAVLVTVTLALLLSVWFLRRSQVAETRLRALSYLGEAMALKDRDTTLAFKLAREAWRVDPSHPDPRIQGRLQEIIQDLMAGLVPHKVLARGKTSYDRVSFSSRGRYLLIMGRDQETILCTGEGDRILGGLPKVRTRYFPGAFSLDERELALADREGWIHHYDLTTHPPRMNWKSRKPVAPNVWTVAWHDSADGTRRLLVCSSKLESESERIENRATVWISGQEDPVDIHRSGGMLWKAGAWLPEGRFVAAGALWDADGSLVRELVLGGPQSDARAVNAAMGKKKEKATTTAPSSGLTPYVRRVLVSPQLMVVITQTGLLQAFDHDGERLWTRNFAVAKKKDQLSEACIDQVGGSLLVTFQDGRVRLLDATTGKARDVDLEYHPHRTVMAADLSADGERITVGNWAGRVGIWDPIGTPADDFLAHSNGILSLAWSPDDKRLLTAGFDGVVKLWDMAKHARQHMLRGISWARFAVSPDGTRLAVIGERGRLTLCDQEAVRQQQKGGSFQSRYQGVTTLDFSPDGKKLLIHALGRHLQVLDLEGRAPVQMGPESSYADIARFVDDGLVLVARKGSHQDLLLWNLQTNVVEVLHRLPEDEVYDRPRLSCGDVSQDGQAVVVGSMEGQVFVVDRSGKRIWKNPTQVGLIRDICFSKDAHFILAGCEDGFAYLWDRKTSKVQSYGPQSSGVIKILFSPDEQQIVVGYKSGRIRIWDRATGQKTLELAGHNGQQIHSLAYTRSGWLVSAGADATVRWWWTDIDKLGQAIEAMDIDLFPR